MIKIRPLILEDIEMILPHYIEYFNQVEKAAWTTVTAKRRLIQLIDRVDNVGLIMEDDKCFVGFVIGQLVQFDDGLVYELNELLVALSFQRLGYGSILITEIEKAARESGAFRIQLFAADDRDHNHFYGDLHGYQISTNNLVRSKAL